MRIETQEALVHILKRLFAPEQEGTVPFTRRRPVIDWDTAMQACKEAYALGYRDTVQICTDELEIIMAALVVVEVDQSIPGLELMQKLKEASPVARELDLLVQLPAKDPEQLRELLIGLARERFPHAELAPCPMVGWDEAIDAMEDAFNFGRTCQ